MIASEVKQKVIEKFKKGPSDTGSVEVQVALLTERINELATHFNKHIHDNHSKLGLMKMIGRRRRLLRYLQSQGSEGKKRYGDLIQALGLRK